MSLDRILQEITTTTNLNTLHQTLETSLPKESRDTLLSSPLASGQDPLKILDLTQNNCISCSSTERYQDFARLAPERVTALAKGIYRYGLSNGRVFSFSLPLFNLVTRYPPDTSYVTTIHPVFLQAALSLASLVLPALPILATPIANVSTLLSDLTYNDNLVDHYLGGVLAMLKRWAEAEEYLEICVTVPGSAPGTPA
ncbi:PCI domain-containing protein [Mycena indigotica]|uniref:PCI domain-containing protein n=1 Tax=Mycena indigotica TaxID=2126181 RepID=A0A8H6TFF6_9AGAR|nr:PCI domain-containing protein [Mycena indigotica]KAF7315717.1 PCI domain-containing protein [Mycena indigotica]